MEPNKQILGQQPDQPVDPTTKQLGSMVAAHETDGPNPPAPATAPATTDMPVMSGVTGEGQQPEPPTLSLPTPTSTPTGGPTSPPDPSPAPPPVSDQEKHDVDLAQRSDVTMHPQDKTIKLPVPTTVLPALLIGILVLLLLIAVAAYAFL